MTRLEKIAMLMVRPWRGRPGGEAMEDAAIASVLAEVRGFKFFAVVFGVLSSFITWTAAFLFTGAVAEWALGSHSPWLDGETAAGRFLDVIEGTLALPVAFVAAAASYVMTVRIVLHHRVTRAACGVCGDEATCVRWDDGRTACLACRRGELSSVASIDRHAGTDQVSKARGRSLPLLTNLVGGVVLAIPSIILLGLWSLTGWEWLMFYALLCGLSAALLLLSLNLGWPTMTVGYVSLALVFIAAWIVTGRDWALILTGGLLLAFLQDALAAAKGPAASMPE